MASKWEVISFVPPEEVNDKVIRVKYYDEIGNPVTAFCMALFTDGSQYKLVAPWFVGPGKFVSIANITEFTPEKVDKSEKEDYGKLKS